MAHHKAHSSAIAKTESVARKLKKGPKTVRVKGHGGVKSQLKQIGKKTL